jgi:hypothetical protein
VPCNLSRACEAEIKHKAATRIDRLMWGIDLFVGTVE